MSTKWLIISAVFLFIELYLISSAYLSTVGNHVLPRLIGGNTTMSFFASIFLSIILGIGLMAARSLTVRH